ncbi:MAG: hypothetical protein ACYCPS_04575 [Candidatus Saccharimonadales bacterium]
MKQKAEPVVSKVFTQKTIFKEFINFKSIYFSLFMVLIIIAIIIGLVISGRGKSTKQESNAACLSQPTIIDQSYQYLSKKDIPGLSLLITNIKKLPNYQLDSNCLYILTAASVIDMDYTQSKAYLQQFNLDYSKNDNIANTLLKYQSISQLRNSVNLLYQQLDRTLSGAGGSIQPKGVKK